MTKTSLVLVAALALAAFGCKPKGGDCEGAIAHSMELSKASMTKMPGVDDKMLGKMHDMGVQHCKDDKWSDDAIKCMVDSKSETDAQSCYGKLKPEQQDKMQKALMALMAAQMPATPPAAAPTTGSAGSATGGDPGAAPAGSAGSATAPTGSAAAH